MHIQILLPEEFSGSSGKFFTTPGKFFWQKNLNMHGITMIFPGAFEDIQTVKICARMAAWRQENTWKHHRDLCCLPLERHAAENHCPLSFFFRGRRSSGRRQNATAPQRYFFFAVAARATGGRTALPLILFFRGCRSSGRRHRRSLCEEKKSKTG